MNRRLLIITIFLLAGVVGSLSYVAGGLAQTQRDRDITVTVVARTEEGEPLDRVIFHVTKPANAVSTYVTDEEGRRTVRLRVPDLVLNVVVTLGFGADKSGLSSREQLDLSKRMTDLFQSHHLDQDYALVVERKKSDYTLPIVAWRSVNVSGVIGLKTALSRQSGIFGPPMSVATHAIGEREFVLRGIRRGVASTIHVVSNDWVIPVDVTAEETEQGNVWLGTIGLPDLERTAAIDIALVNSQALRQTNVRRYRPGVTLIEVSGAVVMTFPSWPDKNDDPVHLYSKPGELFRVPQGEYFVVPGRFARGEEQVQLIDMVRNGSNLINSDLPRLTVEDGRINYLEIDALGVYQAIRTLLSDTSIADSR